MSLYVIYSLFVNHVVAFNSVNVSNKYDAIRDTSFVSDTCAELGCEYHSGAPCQCDSSCVQYKNCCIDYYSQCSPPTSDPTYDHQTEDYVPSHEPATSRKPIVVTPFFAPDHSVDTLVGLIEKANSSVDIMSPGFSSWSGCTPFSGCGGCDPADTRNDKFPVFAAILNAAHRGVKVRVITNNYNSEDCDGKISLLPFLALNNVKVAWYSSTTFLHAKFMIIDNQIVSVSSINFSKTSFTKNREAGATLTGLPPGSSLLQFVTTVFDDDFNSAQILPPDISKWTSEELNIITDSSPIPISIPPPPAPSPDYYVTPKPTPIQTTEGNDVAVYTSPDDALDTLMSDITSAKTSLDLEIYQVNSSPLCEELAQLADDGVRIRILGSSSIYGSSDCSGSNACWRYQWRSGLRQSTTKPLRSFNLRTACCVCL